MTAMGVSKMRCSAAVIGMLCLLLSSVLLPGFAPVAFAQIGVMDSGVTQDLNGVWCLSDASAYAVGDSGVIVHYNGRWWSSMNSGVTVDLYSVWGSADDSVYAGGANGTLLWYDGVNWTSVDTGVNDTILKVWGDSPNDVYALLDANSLVLLRGSKTTWERIESSIPIEPTSLWCSSDAGLFVTTYDPLMTDAPILHYDGGAWTSANSGHSLVRTIWGSGSADIFAAGYDYPSGAFIMHYDGSGWSDMETGGDREILSFWGRSGRDVFGVGTGGLIRHYDGATWRTLDSGMTESFRGISGSPGGSVFIVGLNGVILRLGWSPMDSHTTADLHDVWGASGQDVFAVGKGGVIQHYDGSDWSSMTSGVTKDLYGVWGSSGQDVFAVGDDGTIVHFDGNSWASMPTGTVQELRSVWGASGQTVFCVGFNHTLLGFDGVRWSRLYFPARHQDLHTVWGWADDDIFIGSLDLWRRTELEPAPRWTRWYDAFGGDAVYAVTGVAGTVYAVGQQGRIMQYDGVEWTPMTSGTTNDLHGLWAAGNSNLFAVGAGGTILQFDGADWAPVISGASNDLFGVWGSSDTDVFAIGQNGCILHYRIEPPPDAYHYYLPLIQKNWSDSG